MDRISNFLIFLCNYFLPSFCYTKLAYPQVDLRLRSEPMKRTTKATKRYTSCVMAVTLCASVAAFATPGFTTVYENDFSARTSLSPVPDSRWSEATYVADTDLFVNYATKHGNANQYRSSANAQSQTNHVQDSWLKVYDQSFTNDASFRVLSNGGNQYAAFINDGTIRNINFDHRTHAIHPFFNRISSGVLRMSIDIAMPAHPANTTDNINLFVGPLYEMYMGGF